MSHEITTHEPTIYQCRHIFTDGRRCASPTLRSPSGHEPFCYYHHTTRRPAPAKRVPHSRAASGSPASLRAGVTERMSGKQSTFSLPIPEDPSSIQHAIGEVIRRIASNEIDSRRAGLLLYGLQIASLNLKRNPRNTEDIPGDLVTEISHDPDHGLLAPPAEFVGPHAGQPIGSAQRLLEELVGSDEDQREAAAHQPAVSETTLTPRNLTIDLQACAGSERETIFRMSNFIPKPSSPKTAGLGPKAQKLAALREKAAAQANNTNAPATAGAASAAKPKNSVARKTAFQRKAT